MSSNFIGVIIEESLESKDVLKKIKILGTKVEKVTKKHKTPWLSKQTILSVEIPADKAAKIVDEISRHFEAEHNWCADFKNNELHFIVFRSKVFRVTRTNKKEYDEAKKYGASLGIPKHQIDFHT